MFAQTHQVHLGELVLALNEFYGEMTGEGPQGMYGRVRTRKSRDPMFPGIETATPKGTA